MRFVFSLALIAILSPCAHAVYGGLAADTKQFGFVRYIEMTMKDGKVGACSGTLLERGMVLTAAHCLIDNSNQRVQKVVVKLNRADKKGIEAWGASVHSAYRPNSGSTNDIAILFTFAENDGHANLPLDYAWSKYKAANRKPWFPTFLKQVSVNHLRDIFAKSIPRDPSGQLWAYAVGFGLECPAAKCPTLSNSARYVGKPIYATNVYGCSRGTFDFNTPAPRFCAMTEDASITRPSTTDGKSNINYGDSGGPLFSFDQDGIAVVIGIVNAGNGTYEMFTNVYDQLEFLRNSVNGSDESRVRMIGFGRDGKDSALPKVADAAGLKEVVPMLKEMLKKYDHRVNKKMGSAVHELWADQVTYSGKTMTRDQLRTMLDTYSTRWPERMFSFQKARRASNCSADQCTVVGEVMWSVYRGDEKQEDYSIYTWTLRREAAGWRITSQTTRPSTAADRED